MQIAHAVKVRKEEVWFTSGGTEANNLAIMGAVEARAVHGVPYHKQHILISAIEHASVFRCASVLATKGVRVDTIPVDTEGFIDIPTLRKYISKDTTLVSIIYAHNEFGTVQHMHDISKVVRAARGAGGTYPLLHTDASQAPAWIPCHVPALGVDLLTLDAQKMFGPMGVGALVSAIRVPIVPIVFGGGQEFGIRSGTPAVPLIIGMAQALVIVEEERTSYVPRISTLRDYAIHTVLTQVPSAVVHGACGNDRLANNVHFSFPNLDGEHIVLEMDARGIAVSARSSCDHGGDSGSKMVHALTHNDLLAKGAVRMTLSRYTTRNAVVHAVQTLVEVVQSLGYGRAGIDK
jgi:cysteine desulfurase